MVYYSKVLLTQHMSGSWGLHVSKQDFPLTKHTPFTFKRLKTGKHRWCGVNIHFLGGLVEPNIWNICGSQIGSSRPRQGIENTQIFENKTTSKYNFDMVIIEILCSFHWLFQGPKNDNQTTTTMEDPFAKTAASVNVFALAWRKSGV